jgi:hypothetical protein
MDIILKKMNFKEGMKIRVWNQPTDLEHLIETWRKLGVLCETEDTASMLMAFVQSEEEVIRFFPQLHALSPEDEAIWMAYPKGTSKLYKSTINRDSGWKTAGDYDYEVVKQIAIDENWSALRFRKLKFIKTLTRSFSTKDQ